MADSTELEPIGGGFVVPSSFEVFGLTERGGASFTLTVEIIDGRAHATAITVKPRAGVVGLTSTDLRGVQLRNAMAAGVLANLHHIQLRGRAAKVVPVTERTEDVYDAVRQAVGYVGSDTAWEVGA